MGKVILLVIIVFNDGPSKTYRMPTNGLVDCYTQAAELSQVAPPSADNVVKYLIGCSFEERLEQYPL